MQPKLDAESARRLRDLQKAFENVARSPKLQDAIYDIGAEAMEQMAHTLSGNDIQYSGGKFRINVRTGTLRRSIRMEQPLNGNPFQVGVYNTASYAGAIQRGVTGEERKRQLLSSPAAKTSKAGKKYMRIPSQGAEGWWTVGEDSTLSDQPPRPFLQATMEAMQPIMLERLALALKEIMDE